MMPKARVGGCEGGTAEAAFLTVPGNRAYLHVEHHRGGRCYSTSVQFGEPGSSCGPHFRRGNGAGLSTIRTIPGVSRDGGATD